MQSFNIVNNQYLQCGSEFAKIYYDRMSNRGVNAVMDLFSSNVLCTIESEQVAGYYNWLLKMTKIGIARFEYNNISGTSQPLANNDILVAVQGQLRPINLWQQYVGSWTKFNETFVLEKSGMNYVIKNYIIRLN